MKLKIYVAAPYELRDAAIFLMGWLEADGHDVTSTWLKAIDQEIAETAELDLRDIDRADVLLLLNPAEFKSKGTGGRHVEFGYALAKGKRIIILGAKTNLFHLMNQVELYERPEDICW